METKDGAVRVQTTPPCHFLILNNVQKTKNIHNMLVSASAFGVTEVFIVGQKKFHLQEQESFINSLSCRVTRVATLKDCKALCKERGIRIVGVEIMQNAKSIGDQPFSGDTAFIMGNEGSGMNSAQVAICDDFVYIPQYGGGTASLNVTVAASIVLQSFALWAKLPMTNTNCHMENSVIV
ncbi:family trna rrna methyltransferase-like [Plasmopara halstedii]|uniref:Family trna rrna methyltransferase-like n=1 Tax=Plasmopara halstedii TaxID=4781 RepID=A0A0P1B5T4_PLAHL|nr:family trna rrna methyltransferase-like [Plasmopara halstedii]CEG50193.1 family trna rrna methyltransferase-like [Plasmopara halstedii]|eukprot:XP_024586562.1 family trna rrna methyltransferase-like [Plasmopara halstedii]